MGNPAAFSFDLTHIILLCVYAGTVAAMVFIGCFILKKYRALVNVVRELRQRNALLPLQGPLPQSPSVLNLSQPPEQSERNPSPTPVTNPSCRLPWKSLRQVSLISKPDLILIQLIKAGREGVFYKAKLAKGTCRGHTKVTCKIGKEGTTPKQMENEVAIMRKLAHHKNVVQLLDWNVTEEPYMLILEYMSYGTLRHFVQKEKEQLSADPKLQSHFSIASYHIAMALEHLRSKMIVHCDLALRNILVSRFPWEVKVTEFSLARDLTRMRSRRSTRKKQYRDRVPLRWYPPEYFRNNYYSFKGDVWSFGIVLWEMQTFGMLPYSTLNTSEQVVYNICSGYQNPVPATCRKEIKQIMQDCWLDPYASRPSFTDIVKILENIVEGDCDYVDVDNRRNITSEDELDE